MQLWRFPNSTSVALLHCGLENERGWWELLERGAILAIVDRRAVGGGEKRELLDQWKSKKVEGRGEGELCAEQKYPD